MPVNKRKAVKAKAKKAVTPAPSKPVKKVQPAAVVRARLKASKRAAVAQSPGSDEQFQFFEQGIQLFNKGQFKQAKDCFRKAVAGTSSSISHAALLRVQLCDQRLTRNNNPPPTSI